MRGGGERGRDGDSTGAQERLGRRSQAGPLLRSAGRKFRKRSRGGAGGAAAGRSPAAFFLRHPDEPVPDRLIIDVAIAGLRRHVTAEERAFLSEIETLIEATHYPYRTSGDELDLLGKILRDADSAQVLNPVWLQQVIIGLATERRVQPIEVLREQPSLSRRARVPDEMGGAAVSAGAGRVKNRRPEALDRLSDSHIPTHADRYHGDASRPDGPRSQTESCSDAASALLDQELRRQLRKRTRRWAGGTRAERSPAVQPKLRPRVRRSSPTAARGKCAAGERCFSNPARPYRRPRLRSCRGPVRRPRPKGRCRRARRCLPGAQRC